MCVLLLLLLITTYQLVSLNCFLTNILNTSRVFCLVTPSFMSCTVDASVICKSLIKVVTGEDRETYGRGDELDL